MTSEKQVRNTYSINTVSQNQLYNISPIILATPFTSRAALEVDSQQVCWCQRAVPCVNGFISWMRFRPHSSQHQRPSNLCFPRGKAPKMQLLLSSLAGAALQPHRAGQGTNKALSCTCYPTNKFLKRTWLQSIFFPLSSFFLTCPNASISASAEDTCTQSVLPSHRCYQVSPLVRESL